MVEMQPVRRTLPFLGLLLSLAVMSVAPLRSSAEPAGPAPSPGPAPQAKTTDVRYGPIAVPAAVGGHAGEFAAVVPAMPMPCTNCFLTGTKVDLVFEDGRSANLDSGLMLHHIVAFNAGRPDATCAPETPIGPLGERFLAAGHVHDGGIRIDLANETTARHLCTSYAGYGTNPAYQGSVEKMTTCTWDRLGTVRAGEVLSIDTYYDPPEAQSDVMGIVLAYVYETDDLAGGTEPPAGVQAPAPAWPPPAGRPAGHGHGAHHH